MFKDLIQSVGVYLTSFTIYSEMLKKTLKMTSQLVIFRAFFSTGHFQSFFLSPNP